MRYIEQGDERLLNILFAVASEYQSVAEEDAEEIAELERRREKRLSGESKIYDWEEAKKIITSREHL